MKLIIDIPEEEYKMRMIWAKSDSLCSPDTLLIAKGVPYEERPHGKWVIEHDWVHCFPCGHEQNYPSNFCPNCGADMRKGDET